MVKKTFYISNFKYLFLLMTILVILPSLNQIDTTYNVPAKRNDEVLKSFTTDMKCGVANPSYQEDCGAYSTLNNSCCFYKYNTFKGCFSLGSKFEGSSEYNGISFECNVIKIKMSIFILLISISLALH